MILERPHHFGSCRAAADDANRLVLCLHQDCTQHLAEANQRESINNMRRGRMTSLTTSHITDRITRFLCSSSHLTFDAMQRFGLSCHVLSGENMLYGVHRPVCFLETLCHVVPRHVIFNQTTARSLFVRRRQSPDDVMWRRAATGQMHARASATCAALNSTDATDSGNCQRHEWMLPSEHNNNTEAARTNSTTT